MHSPVIVMLSRTLNTEVLQLLSTKYTVIVSQDTDGQFRIELSEDDRR